MGRRRRFFDPEQRKPFYDAFDAINNWERRVVRTVPIEFTLTNLVDFLYPPEALVTLRAAFKLTGESHPDRSELIRFAGPGVTAPVTVEVRIDCDDAKICSPRQGLVCPQTDHHGIVQAMIEIAHVVQEWNVVRDVVQWFNDHATPSSARYYFPAMGNFLSSDHEFHQCSGVRYVEPRQSIGLIAHKVRLAAETVTMALHCPDKEHDARGMFLTVMGDEGKEGYYAKKSQMFVL